ncbi:hypothetical protein SmJEL517_g01449 [Synchytrium microbalum]|uniref:CBS domain-containing protein n=1 Tax=Synchytrium microbalum TaxID=1806994 RepID=A0A507C5H8_9FUNG|nr:uncharacterized protein SmJEL517_g01449 [Synchytrium microbalum]TPX36247.1 hypothetical protein SmJEL517_g01449 [Synchytrium microbalum]
MSAPIVPLRAASTPEKQIFASLQYLNGSGTIKERYASKILSTINLQQGCVLVVGSTGNFALAVARQAAGRCHVLAVLPERKTSTDKVKMMKSLGVEIVRTPLGAHNEAPEHPKQLAKSIAATTPNAILVDEYQSDLTSVFDEILTETTQANIAFDTLVVSLKEIVDLPLFTAAVAKRLGPAVKVITVSSAADAAKKVETGSYIHERDAYSTARRLISQEGVLAGVSSGMVVAAALKSEGKKILCILDDAAYNYASTLLNDDFLLEQNLLDDSMLREIRSRQVERYRGASVEDLQLPSAVCILESSSVGDARTVMIERDFSYLPVINARRKMIGFVSLGSVDAHLSSREVQLETPVSAVAFKTFSRDKEFKLITPSTPLVELDTFFDTHPAAFITDEAGEFPLGVCTKLDLIRFLNARRT